MTDEHKQLLYEFLHINGQLKDVWSGNNIAGSLRLSAKQTLVSCQLLLMDDGEEHNRLQVMTENDEYSLTYDEVWDTNPNPGCDLSLFTPNSIVAAKIQIHVYNFFKTKTKNMSFDYTFRLQSIYLVKGHEKEVATPRK